MPRRKLKRKKNKKEGSLIQKILALFIVIFALTVGIYSFTSNNSGISSIAEKDSLQIEVYNPNQTPTPTKTPGTTSAPSQPGQRPQVACNHNNGIPNESPACYCSTFLFECKEKKCVRFFADGKEVPNGCGFGPVLGNLRFLDHYCSVEKYAPTDGIFCVGKPVIYLYPEVPTLVDVKVETDGDIFVSDPPYPDEGWKNVLAHPDGKLIYEGNEYRELFYESNVKDIRKPSKGLTVNSRNIRGELDSIITKLGLIQGEKTEFLDYWIPRLQALNSPYIFFSIIDPSEKDRIDKVFINPKPDTFIEFIAYFAPLEKPYDGKKLELPSIPPVRVGFTAVEWGGTIGR
jgi:hypothetical protein